MITIVTKEWIELVDYIEKNIKDDNVAIDILELMQRYMECLKQQDRNLDKNWELLKPYVKQIETNKKRNRNTRKSNTCKNSKR